MNSVKQAKNLARLALVVKTSDALFNLQESVLQGNKKRIDRYMKLIKELSE